MSSLNDYLPTSPDHNATRLAELKRLFPDLFTNEGQLDTDALRQLANPSELGSEKFQFTWYGKSRAKRKAFSPSKGALVYDAARSVNPDKADGNMIIEGENLEVLKLLTSAYMDSVKCIYIDPPYNTGKDFIYPDNYTQSQKEYWEQNGSIEEGVRMDTNPETSGRYHSDWLSMMYSRLLVARLLLRDDGIIFVSIDDNEAHHLRKLLDEVFGEENFVGKITWKNVTDNNPTRINKDHEYIICVAKNANELPQFWKSDVSESKELIQNEYLRLKNENLDPEELEKNLQIFLSDNKDLVGNLSRYKRIDDTGVYTGSESVHNTKAGGYDYEILHPDTQQPMRKPANGYRFPKDSYEALLNNDVIIFGEDHKRIIKLKKYLHDYQDSLRSVITMDGRLGSYDIKRLFNGKKVFDNPKPVDLLRNLISFVTNDNDLVVDLFSGSGVVPQAIFELNAKYDSQRQFIAIQLPEKIEKNTDGGKAAISYGLEKISDITISRSRIVAERYKNNLGHLESGFKVYKLQKSRFPRVEFQPDVDKTEEENIEALKVYIAEKENSFQLAFDRDAVIDEVLLKHGFKLTYTLTAQADVSAKNEVFLAQEGERTALICLDYSLDDATVDYFKDNRDHVFICLERALDTTKKWNLKHYLGDRLKSI